MGVVFSSNEHIRDLIRRGGRQCALEIFVDLELAHIFRRFSRGLHPDHINRCCRRELFRVRQVIDMDLHPGIAVAVMINVATMRNSLDPYYESKEPGDYEQETWRMTEAAAQWIDTRTPKDAVILHRYPPIFELLSDRRVYGYLLLRGRPLPPVD